jgi:hypothetical protein
LGSYAVAVLEVKAEGGGLTMLSAISTSSKLSPAYDDEFGWCVYCCDARGEWLVACEALGAAGPFRLVTGEFMSVQSRRIWVGMQQMDKEELASSPTKILADGKNRGRQVLLIRFPCCWEGHVVAGPTLQSLG